MVVVVLCVLLLVVLCVWLSSYVYLLYYVCIAVLTFEAGLLAGSQYSEGPVTGHLNNRFFLSSLLHRAFRRITLIINQQMHLYTISH